jgi:four helix bundle protein
MSVNSYQDLIVWQKAMDLAEQCYRTTRTFPRDELYGMTSQICRAATSIPANIAEGWGRGTTKQYVHFLRIAQGSTKELETLLLLSRRVDLLTDTEARPLLQLLAEVSRMTISLIGSLKRSRERGRE